MYGLYEVGMEYPRPEDYDRMQRYAEARDIFDGQHQNLSDADRLEQKLRELSSVVTQYSNNIQGEGVVYLVYNLPRLVCEKFADLQVLQTPMLIMDDDDQQQALELALGEDVPDLWARWHYALTLKRAYGDVLVCVSRAEDNGPVDLRVVSPDRWFPVLDDNDPLTVEAHQIAWTEDHEVGRKAKTFLRVDVCYPDRIERRAFEVDKASKKPVAYSTIGGTVSKTAPDALILTTELQPEEMEALWPGMSLMDQADLGGLFPCFHLRNGQLSPESIFGRPQFLDCSSLIDDINWRLGSWSDINDKISNPPHIVPGQYLDQDENSNVYAPSRFRQTYVQKNRSGDAGEVPKYMTVEHFTHETLALQLEQSILAFLLRNEMSPALLGLQFGKEKESGEAKSLGMGTTEAATRRDLLQINGTVDQALTALARLRGIDTTVKTYWRVGLPKSQAQLLDELVAKRNAGLVTRKDMIAQLYPFLTDDEVEAKLADLDEERDGEMQRESALFAEQG